MGFREQLKAWKEAESEDLGLSPELFAAGQEIESVVRPQSLSTDTTADAPPTPPSPTLPVVPLPNYDAAMSRIGDATASALTNEAPIIPTATTTVPVAPPIAPSPTTATPPDPYATTTKTIDIPPPPRAASAEAAPPIAVTAPTAPTAPPATQTVRDTTVATNAKEAKKAQREANRETLSAGLAEDETKAFLQAAGYGALRDLTWGAIDRAIGQGVDVGEALAEIIHGLPADGQAGLRARHEYLAQESDAYAKSPVGRAVGSVLGIALPVGASKALSGAQSIAAAEPIMTLAGTQGFVSGALNTPSDDWRDQLAAGALGGTVALGTQAVVGKAIDKLIGGAPARRDAALIRDVGNPDTGPAAASLTRKELLARKQTVLKELKADPDLAATIRKSPETGLAAVREKLESISEPRPGLYKTLEETKKLRVGDIQAAITRARNQKGLTENEIKVIDDLERELTETQIPQWRREGSLIEDVASVGRAAKLKQDTQSAREALEAQIRAQQLSLAPESIQAAVDQRLKKLSDEVLRIRDVGIGIGVPKAQAEQDAQKRLARVLGSRSKVETTIQQKAQENLVKSQQRLAALDSKTATQLDDLERTASDKLAVDGLAFRHFLSKNQIPMSIASQSNPAQTKELQRFRQDILKDAWQTHLDDAAKVNPKVVDEIRKYDKRASALATVKEALEERTQKGDTTSKLRRFFERGALASSAVAGVAHSPKAAAIALGAYGLTKYGPGAARVMNDKVLAPFAEWLAAGTRKPLADALATAAKVGIPQGIARSMWERYERENALAPKLRLTLSPTHQ